MLASALAALGFLLTTRPYIFWLNNVTPLVGLAVYYVILYGALYLLSKAGLTVLNVKIEQNAQTVGLLMITFAFFITVDLTSSYVQFVATGSAAGIANVYLQSEDGAVFWVWQHLLPLAGDEVWRILTYVLTPFTLALVGCGFVTGKIKIGA